MGKEFANKHENNPIAGYLNINHLENKTDALTEICIKLPIDTVCIDEPKFDSSISDSQFYILGYQFLPLQKGRNKRIDTAKK